MNSNDHRPWDQLDEETSAQFHAFKCYRDLGLARSYQAAWEKYAEVRGLTSDEPHPNFRNVWPERHNWDERCRAFDKYQDRQQQKELIEARQEAMSNLAGQASQAAGILALAAVGREEMHEGAQDFDQVQLQAIRELLNRVNVDSPDQIELAANVESEQSVEHSLDVDVDALLDQFEGDNVDVIEKFLYQLLSESDE